MSGRALSLRISVTDRCGLRCAYCSPGGCEARSAGGRLLSFEEILRFVRLVKRGYTVAEARLTGGEPLLRAGIVTLVEALDAEGVGDLSLTTNGQQLAEFAAPLKAAGLNRLNVSLDSLAPETFGWLTGGAELGRTLEGIGAAVRAGLRPVKLNMVVLKGCNDHEVCDLVRFAIESGCQARFLELMPIGRAGLSCRDLYVSSAEVRERLSAEFSITPLPVDPEATSRNYRLRGRRGLTATVGFISPCSEPFCSMCPRLRLTADGTLLGCLARPQGISVAGLLRRPDPADGAGFVALIERALRAKRRDGAFLQPRAMAGIGG